MPPPPPVQLELQLALSPLLAKGKTATIRLSLLLPPPPPGTRRLGQQLLLHQLLAMVLRHIPSSRQQQQPQQHLRITITIIIRSCNRLDRRAALSQSPECRRPILLASRNQAIRTTNIR
jgi:hypothetical protein